MMIKPADQEVTKFTLQLLILSDQHFMDLILRNNYWYTG